MRPAVIYDFHGTLVNVDGIRYLLAQRNYDGFYERSLSCPPIEETVSSCRRTNELGYTNFLFTAMPDRYAEGLAQWLKGNGVHIDHVAMRTVEDGFKKNFVVKERMYYEAVERGYYMARAWEDDPAIVRSWQRLGIPVDVVPGYVENLIP